MDAALRALRAGVRAPRGSLSIAAPSDLDAALKETDAAEGPMPQALDFFGDDAPLRQQQKANVATSADADAENKTKADDSPSAELRSTLPAKLANGIAALGVTSLTPIQRRTYALLEDKDVLAVAPTGSGKTYAYVLPLLAAFCGGTGADAEKASDKKTRVLVLVPTRELAAQVTAVVTRLVKAAGLHLRVREVASKGATSTGVAQLIVATPMAASNALARKNLDIGVVRHVVLDEADRLLDDAFLEQVDTVMAAAGAQGSTPPRVHMFSATLPGGVEVLARNLLRNPVKVVVAAGAYGGAAAVTGLSAHIAQRFQFVGGRGEQGKVLAVRQMLRSGLKPPVLLFVQSRHRAALLFRELVFEGIAVDAIHADRTHAARESAVRRFRDGSLWMLIATDVLARGLDFRAVNTVINYDVPASPMAYVHRIGRTGRNGRSGEALTLFTEEDKLHLPRILKLAKASGAEVPEWALQMRTVSRKEKVKKLEIMPPKRKRLGGPNCPKVSDQQCSYRMPKRRGDVDEEDGGGKRKKKRKKR